jgi:hypothetical protein
MSASQVKLDSYFPGLALLEGYPDLPLPWGHETCLEEHSTMAASAIVMTGIFPQGSVIWSGLVQAGAAAAKPQEPAG